MNPIHDLSRLYTDVSDSIAIAMAEISELKVEHKDGKKELGNMMERLSDIRARFNSELNLLDKHAEWDKFTMAFFGETNAGKSTIIESLRIIFKEESRQQLLQQNMQDLVKYEQALAVHVDQVRNGLIKVYEEYSAEIIEINHSAVTLHRILKEESSARINRKLWLYAISGVSLGAIMAGVIAMIAGV